MSLNGKRAFKYLKDHGDSTAQEVADGIHVPVDEVESLLNEYVKSGFLEFNNADKHYKVKFPLDPPLPKDEAVSTRFWQYEKILDAKEKLSGGGAPSPRTLAIPRKWRNPYLKYLPHLIDQGDCGTCVGFAYAMDLTLKYFKLTQDLPTQSELDAAQRNVEINIGCPNKNPFICDRFDKRWKSPRFIYTMARNVGKVTDPEGAYVSDAAKVCLKYGSVFETECNTSKSVKCTADWFPKQAGETTAQAKARIMKSALNHLATGFAQITTFDALCEAIYTHGSVIVPIDIYSNYTSGGCVGIYPDPDGENIGGHAQCAVGYDLDARTIEFRQSWGENWSEDGGITEKYYNLAAGASFVILDNEETRIGEQIYTKITVSANVPCNFTINGENHTFKDMTVMIERGVAHTIVATPVDQSKVVEPSQSVTITPTGDSGKVEFTFTIKTVTPEPNDILIKRIMELLKKILEILKKENK